MFKTFIIIIKITYKKCIGCSRKEDPQFAIASHIPTMKTCKSYRKLFNEAGITDEQQMEQVYDFLVQMAKLQVEAQESWTKEAKGELKCDNTSSVSF